jgi:hypothetical protein
MSTGASPTVRLVDDAIRARPRAACQGRRSNVQPVSAASAQPFILAQCVCVSARARVSAACAFRLCLPAFCRNIRKVKEHLDDPTARKRPGIWAGRVSMPVRVTLGVCIGWVSPRPDTRAAHSATWTLRLQVHPDWARAAKHLQTRHYASIYKLF